MPQRRHPHPTRKQLTWGSALQGNTCIRYHNQLRGGENTIWYREGTSVVKKRLIRTVRPIDMTHPTDDSHPFPLPSNYVLKVDKEANDKKNILVVFETLQWEKGSEGETHRAVLI